MENEYHIEVIECPFCEDIQRAKVEHTEPFFTYIHWCENCNHVITESEWNEVL